MRYCKTCGAPLGMSAHATRLYCSNKCKVGRKPRRATAGSIKCAWCGDRFQPTHPQQVHCFRLCSTRKYRALHPKPPKPRVTNLVCACGKTYLVNPDNQTKPRRCPDCVLERRREYDKRRRARRKTKRWESRVVPEVVIKCASCMHGFPEPSYETGWGCAIAVALTCRPYGAASLHRPLTRRTQVGMIPEP